MVVNEASLNTSAQQFRKELLIMAVLGLGRSLPHLTLRTGVRYSETVGELDGPVELRPYTGEKNETDDLEIDARTLYTFLGSCVKEFDPNALLSTIYGSNITNGEALKDVPITKQVLALMMKKISGGLNKALFSGVRNAGGETTAALFNGFDTITAAEITAAKIAVGKSNYMALPAIDDTNAVDVLQSIYEGSSDELQDVKSKLYLPKNVYTAYNKDYKQTTGATPYNKEYKKTFLEGSDDMCELVPMVAKKASPYIHLSTKSNMLVGVNQKGEEEKIEVRRGDNPFKLQFINTLFFGTQIESLSKERLMVGHIGQI